MNRNDNLSKRIAWGTALAVFCITNVWLRTTLFPLSLMHYEGGVADALISLLIFIVGMIVVVFIQGCFSWGVTRAFLWDHYKKTSGDNDGEQ